MDIDVPARQPMERQAGQYRGEDSVPDLPGAAPPSRQAARSGGAARLQSWVLTRYLPPVIVLAILLGGWQAIIVAFNVPPFMAPSPIAVAQGFANNAAPLLTGAYYTLRDALAGFAISIVAGVMVAMLLSQSRVLERAISPYATMLQTIPIIAIAPIINQLIGIGEPAIVVIAFIIAVFPIISNTTVGLTSVDHNLLNLFQMNNASRWQQFWKLRLPNALPYLLAGVRISSGLAVIGAFVGEVFAGSGGDQGGLGYVIMVAGAHLQMDILFAATLLSAALGIAVFVAVNIFNHWVLYNWHESSVQREN